MNQIQQLHDFNTAEISDALDACGVEGALAGIGSLSTGIKLIGPAYTVKFLAYAEKPLTFKGAADYIDAIPAQSVVVIDNNGRTDCTVWGDILTQFAVKKEIAGTVVYGAVRDIAAIRKIKYPVFSCASYMRSGKNRVYKAAEQCAITIANVTIMPGDIIFADDNGVIVIPMHLINEVIEKATTIQQNENKIQQAIASGLSLAAARKTYHYDQPWLKSED